MHGSRRSIAAPASSSRWRAARAYPAHLVDRLERLTADGHQLIYHRRELGFARLEQVIAVEFPAAVETRIAYVAVATAVFVLPTLIVGLLVYRQPEMILTVVDAETAASCEEMYSLSAESIGRGRTADTDWMMFGHYIRNNISVAFQCFAGGLFAGLGSLFFLGYNGVHSGAIGGYLTERGLSSTFYSFIVTHSAFELTAIVLSGAAGLQIGHALLETGAAHAAAGARRGDRESAVVLYGVTAMLLVAAAIEAFWSSAAWLPHPAKYGVAVVCWIAVIELLRVRERHAD